MTLPLHSQIPQVTYIQSSPAAETVVQPIPTPSVSTYFHIFSLFLLLVEVLAKSGIVMEAELYIKNPTNGPFQTYGG